MVNSQKKVCIVGAGGFGRETLCCFIDSLKGKTELIKDLACFMVDDDFFIEEEIMGVDVIPRSEFNPEKYEVVVAVGDPLHRQKIVETLPANTVFTRIIHPSALVSKWVEIGEGSIVTAGVIITCGIKIGKHAHLNLHTSIGHDTVIGDFFTTAPGSRVSGNCNIADNVYLGTNTSIKQGITVTSNVTIGMGGIVIKDIIEEGVYVGNPIRKLEK